MTSATNKISKNITGTVSINSDEKKVRYIMDCYILNKILLVTILLFMTGNICYHCVNHRSKHKIMAH